MHHFEGDHRRSGLQLLGRQGDGVGDHCRPQLLHEAVPVVLSLPRLRRRRQRSDLLRRLL
jgi:hypothetical protein